MALAGLATITAFGCKDTEKVLSAEGGSCETILDCQAGLSCVATDATSRVCRLASVQAPPVEEDATADANTTTPDATVEDTGVLDSEAPDASDGASDGSSGDANDAGDAADGRG